MRDGWMSVKEDRILLFKGLVSNLLTSALHIVYTISSRSDCIAVEKAI